MKARSTWPHQHKRLTVADLKPDAPVHQLELVVLRVYPQRLVITPSYSGPVAAACGRDATGVVGLVLWSEQVQDVRVGDIVRIHSGWCRQRDGALVVSTGKHGRMAIVSRIKG
ncbi:MAG: hypothetical protein L7S56_07480 [Candidatus Poseidonia sp.]|nr:hypothetical protein [Poseidonia sp.]